MSGDPVFSPFIVELARGLDPQLADIVSQLHFLRAQWFYAFIPLLLYLSWMIWQPVQRSSLDEFVDARLAPFILAKPGTGKRRLPMLLTFITVSLCITALAGPVYKKLPQPVYREISSLVLLLDLSQSMNAEDIRPSRLQRAKLELLDILEHRKSGQTALVVYAADAFVVTPLTDDIATIENLVPSLQTDMMPAQGSNLSAALARSFALLDQSGVIDGNILVITDDIDASDSSAIEKVAAQGHRLSIFGIGTAQGAPIPRLPSGDETAEQGGFLLDAQGRIVIPRLDEQKLRSLALAGGGAYVSLSADESDTASIDKLVHSSKLDREGKDTTDEDEMNADLWREEGHWLLLPLLLLASLWFRRGWIALLVVFTLPLPQPAYADESTGILQNLWLTPDQQAMQAFRDNDHARAAKTFKDPRWQASALYRNGDYDRSAELLKDIKSSDAQYNRGNALANMGQYQEALKAYDEALSLDAGNEDAAYNREQVKQALDAMKQQDGQQQDGQQQDEQQQQDGQQGQASDQQQGEQQDADQRQQNAQQSSDDEQQGEETTDTSEQGDQDQAQDTEQQDVEQQDQPSPGQMSEQQQNKQEEQSLQQRDAEQEQQQAQKEMEDYLKSQQQDTVQNRDGAEPPQEMEVNPEQVEASITEKQQATRQWLRRIPDDPSGLLRRKFLYQYKHLPDQRDSEQPW